ncbi:MAG: glycerate kinase type-2 family protein [Thermoprotei archaeon]
MNSLEMRKILLDTLNEALSYMDPANLIKNSVKISDNKFIVNNLELNLHKIKRIFVVGGGKAVGRMAFGIESILNDRINNGLIIVPYGSNIPTLRHIKVVEARHPIPDQNGVNGVRMMLELLKTLDEDDLVIVLISGGGSALMPLPVDGITLEEKSNLIKSLMLRGADIRELNTVRKHLSRIKGGQLARYLYPANVLSLIISDVVENPLDVIASGPTAPDPTTFSDAINVLKRYNLWEGITENVKDVLLKGVRGEIPETPKPGDPIFENVNNIIIADNSYACKVVVKILEKKGIHSVYLSSSVEGEARYVGSVIGDIVKGIGKGETSLKRPLGLVIGGETTVTVRGSGVGGRNQELCLSAAFRIRGLKNVVLASIGTDGIDGVTDAAGAIVDGDTIDKGLTLGLDPSKYLENNDTYTFFKNLGDLVITGPTGNNMNDVIVSLIF